MRVAALDWGYSFGVWEAVSLTADSLLVQSTAKLLISFFSKYTELPVRYFSTHQLYKYPFKFIIIKYKQATWTHVENQQDEKERLR